MNTLKTSGSSATKAIAALAFVTTIALSSPSYAEVNYSHSRECLTDNAAKYGSGVVTSPFGQYEGVTTVKLQWTSAPVGGFCMVPIDQQQAAVELINQIAAKHAMEIADNYVRGCLEGEAAQNGSPESITPSGSSEVRIQWNVASGSPDSGFCMVPNYKKDAAVHLINQVILKTAEQKAAKAKADSERLMADAQQAGVDAQRLREAKAREAEILEKAAAERAPIVEKAAADTAEADRRLATANATLAQADAKIAAAKDAEVKAEAAEKAARQHAALAKAKVMTSEEFRLDAKHWADRGTKVALFGRYLKTSDGEYLIASGDSIDTGIPIFTNNASREFRKVILNASEAATEVTPINLMIVGTASLCTTHNGYGVQLRDDVPCIEVDDGWQSAGDEVPTMMPR